MVIGIRTLFAIVSVNTVLCQKLYKIFLIQDDGVLKASYYANEAFHDIDSRDQVSAPECTDNRVTGTDGTDTDTGSYS